ELWDAFRHIWKSSRVKGGLLLLTFSQAMIATISAVAPGYARSVLGVEVTDTSLLMLAPAALGMIAGALILSRFGHLWNKRALIVGGVFLAGLLLVGLGSVRGADDIFTFVNIVIVAMGLLFLLGAANAMIDVPSQTALQIHTPEELRGRIYGVLNTLVNSAAFLPVLFAGVIADVFSVPVVIILMGIMVFFTGFYIQDKARSLS
ncbi:MAG TPA: MFS transporter, partial [Patescibacteria group bacterium]|nr:MFS transporter [Patescibacteria group bacterium]